MPEPRRRRRVALPLLVWSLAALRPGGLAAQDLPLRAILGEHAVAGMRWGDITDVRPALDSLYRRTGWRPLWTRDGSLSPEGRRVLEQLRGVATVGLDPADYDIDWLAAGAGLHPTTSPSASARYDIVLSADLLRALRALGRGRVDPRRWYPQLMPREMPDLPGLLEAMSRGAAADSAFLAVQPRHPRYAALVRALAAFRLAAARPPRLPVRVRPGDSLPDAAGLRDWLRLLGALDTAAPAGAGDRYDTLLVRAVRTFQEREGLGADGIIGPATRARLLLPRAERIRQIEFALERWRWLTPPTGGPYLEVNVAAQQMVAWRGAPEGDSAVLVSRVIVGTPPRHATPMFATIATGVQFHPAWRIPSSIALEEILPRLRRDPGVMAREGFDFYRGDSLLAPDTSLLRRVGRGIDLRQRPGPLNPLGEIKLVMTNPADVYLHDTPGRSLFDRPLRTFSHGCVRVARAVDLAALLLEMSPETAPEWRGHLAADTTVTVRLDRRVPVIITYHTAAITPAGTLAFHADLYGADRRLGIALRGGYPFPGVTAASGPSCC